MAISKHILIMEISKVSLETNMTYDIPVATYNIDIKGDTSFIPFLIIFTGV